MRFRDRRDVQCDELVPRQAVSDVATGEHERRWRLLTVDPLEDDLLTSYEIALEDAVPPPQWASQSRMSTDGTPRRIASFAAIARPLNVQ